MIDPVWLGAAEGGALIRAGGLTPLAWTEALLDRIATHDGKVNAFLTVFADRARAGARIATDELARGFDRGPLHGVPYGLKDIIDLAGHPTTCHSALGRDRIAGADAPVVARLAAAGAILLGKLATHEFAIGGPSFDLPWPPARNPWNLGRFPGGSSSGSGAALAAGFLPLAVGTDTAGSVRNPAAQCGIVGFKPTYDRVPRTGVFPLAWSLDTVGPMARHALDAGLMFQAMADGAPRPPPALDLAGCRIGVVRRWHEIDAPGDATMVANFEAMLGALARAGAVTIPIDLPPLTLWQSVTRVILSAEGFAVHEADLSTRAELYGALARSRLMGGAELRAVDYLRAQRERAKLIDIWTQATADVDLIACLSSMDPAPPIDDGPQVQRTYLRQARAPANLLGVPAINLPTGFTADGLPTSMQIMGRAGADASVLAAAMAIEALCPWNTRRPTL